MSVLISIDNNRSTPLVFDPLIVDQSAGITDNDVNLDYVDTIAASDPLTGVGYNAAFLALINGLSSTQLSEAAKAFAATAEGATSNTDFVQVNVTGGDVVSDLFFSGAGGAALNGVEVVGMTTLAGGPIYLWAAANSDFAIATTSNVSSTAGRVVAAFYLNEAANHLSAQVQMVTFEPIDHPLNPDADDSLNFTDVLKVSAASTLSFSFDNLDSGNFLYAAFGTTSAGLLMTGEDLNVNDTLKQNGDPSTNFGKPLGGSSDPSDTINTSQGGVGATVGVNTQDFRDGGGVAVITLVTGFIPLTGITDGSTFGHDVRDILYDQYINTASASIFLSQQTGSGAAGMTVTLWEAGGNNDAGEDPTDNSTGSLVAEEGYGPIPNTALSNEGYIGDDDTDVQLKNDWPVAVGSVTIRRAGIDYTWTAAGGTPVSPPTYQGVQLNVTFGGNSFTVVGLTGLDKVTFTAADDPANALDGTFNRFKIEASEGNFDIGAISLSQGTTSSQSVGDLLRVDDDGPSAAPVLNAAATMSVDETLPSDTSTISLVGVTKANDLDLVDTTGTAIGRAVSGAAVLTPNAVFGADGAAAANSLTYALSILDADSVANFTTTEGNAINLVLQQNNTVLVGVVVGGTFDGQAAFAIAIGATSGIVTVEQYLSLDHPVETDPDDALSFLAASVGATVTVKDGDGDSATPTAVDISSLFTFRDDGPNANGTAQSGTVDEDGTPLNGGLPSGTDDDATATKTATGNVSAIFNPGADGPGAYLISNDAAKIGLLPSLTSQGGSVLYNVNTATNTLTAYVEVSNNAGYNIDDDREVFTLVLDSISGAYSFVLIDQLDHAAPAAGTSFENELVLNLGAVLSVSDGDGDTAFAAADRLVMTIDDDSPVINSLDTANDITYNNSDNPTPGGSGVFSYSIGFDDRDSYSDPAAGPGPGSDLLVTLTSGTVGTGAGNAITNRSVTWISENDLLAQFSFAFTYVSNPTNGNTTNATGTLIFDKDDGTYSISLTAPIVSFGVLTLADVGAGFTGYLEGTSTTTGSTPPVTVAALDDDFFVQFTGDQETNGGTDGNSAAQQALVGNNHNLDALSPGEAWSNGDDDAFSDGELFTQSGAWVSVSGTAAGVAGDTMQSGEVLDFNFYKENPEGFLNPAGIDKATSSTIFIEFDALDNGEDLVVILKLLDKTTGQTTTRAVIVQYDDIFHKAQANQIPASFGFTGTLDNNDGLVVIESNDYNILQGDNWTITGAQVLASTEGVSGMGINLNRAIGTGGGSPSTPVALNTIQDSGRSNGGTWDGDVFKIVNIGFLTETTPDSELNFGVRVIDFDGDTTASQTITVDIDGDDPAALSLSQQSFHQDYFI